MKSSVKNTEADNRSRVAIIYLIGCMCTLSGLLYGYNLGVIAGAILFVVDEFNLTATLEDVLVSSALLGAMIGAVAGGKLSDKFGRRRILALGALVGFIGALVSAVSPVYEVLIAGRITAGLSIGILTCVTPLFIAELSPTHLRGRLGALFSVALAAGLLTSYISDVAFRSSEYSWRWMFVMGIAPAILLFIATLMLPESPRWLVAHDRMDRARAVLGRFIETQKIEGKIEAIREGLTEQKGRWSDLAKPFFRIALIVAVGIATIRQATGVAIGTFWAPELFHLAGFNKQLVDLLGTIGVGTVYLIGSFVGLWLVDRYGRRPLMLYTLCGMAVTLGVLTIMFQLPSFEGWQRWVVISAFMLFSTAFICGPGVVVFLLISELLPLQIRALGMGLANLALWAAYLLSTLSFPIMIDMLGNSGTFFTYALLCSASWLFVYRLTPETKGRTLEEIEAAWRTPKTVKITSD